MDGEGIRRQEQLPDQLTTFWWFWFLSWCKFLFSKGDGAGVSLGQNLQAFYRWIAGFYDTDEPFHGADRHLFLVIDSRILIIRSRGGFYSRQKPRNLHITVQCSAIIHFQSNHALQRSESEMPYRWTETMARTVDIVPIHQGLGWVWLALGNEMNKIS